MQNARPEADYDRPAPLHEITVLCFCVAKQDCSVVNHSALMVNYTNCEMKDKMGSCCSSLRSEFKFPGEWKDDKAFRSAGVPASHSISNLSDNLAWKGQSFQV
jgi:hypothetical protein